MEAGRKRQNTSIDFSNGRSGERCSDEVEQRYNSTKLQWKVRTERGTIELSGAHPAAIAVRTSCICFELALVTFRVTTLIIITLSRQ